MGVYAADGSLRMSINDSQVGGLYTPSGALRGSTLPGVGLYHTNGAYRVQLNGPGWGTYDTTGALRVADFPGFGAYSNTGALRITDTGGVVVTGEGTPAGLLLIITKTV